MSSRIRDGGKWESEVKPILERIGFTVEQTGQEYLLTKDEMGNMRKRFCEQLPCADGGSVYRPAPEAVSFVIHFPDIFAFNESWQLYIDAKASLNGFDIQEESYQNLMRISRMGVRVAVVFKGWKMGFVDELTFVEEYLSWELEWVNKRRKHGGSGTPYRRVDPRCLFSFSDFMSTLPYYPKIDYRKLLTVAYDLAAMLKKGILPPDSLVNDLWNS